MALTRPTIQNINTNLTTFSDSLTVTNFGNIANRDIGEVFDRSQGGGSNVAIFWNEAIQGFRLAYTTSTGKDPGNLTITADANLTVGNLTAGNISAGNLIVANIIYENTEYVSSTEVVAGNSTVNGLTVNTSATVGTTLSVTGNLTTSNILPSANAAYNLGSPTLRYKSLYLSGNTIYMDGTTISSNATSITFTNPGGGSFTVGGTTALTASTSADTSQYVTQPTQSNITSVGTLTGLTLSGTLVGTTLNAATFGNAGATFTGSYFNAAGSFYGPYSGVIGGGGANSAIFTTVTSTGNSTVSALTVNGAATIGTSLGVAGNITAGNITTTGIDTVGTLNVTGNVTAGNATVSGTTSISSITKLNIPGGVSGYVIKTDGFGNLSWQPDNSGGITFTAALNPPVSGNLKGDQWYNTATDVIYEYAYDGTSYYWVDVSGAAFGNSAGTGDQLNPFLLMGA